MSDIIKESLKFHKSGNKGKIGVKLNKNLCNQHDLSLAYSPGVSAPCLAIYKNPEEIYDYTSKGNFVAVISNGTAVLGLGNLGAGAAKPVMEGKAALFKKFADIDSIDIEINETDPVKFIEIVEKISITWGGINLEDIRSPECFYIEDELKKRLDIPVFHDDQHGTAIVTSAALLNALEITNRKISDVKIVVNGAGAAAIACVNLIKKLGARNIVVCDRKGVISLDRSDELNSLKKKLATNTNAKTLGDAMKDSDVFIGLSVAGVVSKDMIASMSDDPIVFAMANPDPEIYPDEIMDIRGDAVIATGRSDYKNQVNNFVCFPYLFRGALDVRATLINDEMKLATVYALSNLAKNCTKETKILTGAECVFGKDYIIPTTFDSRLLTEIPIAVAKAAMNSGVAKKPIEDFDKYKESLKSKAQLKI